MKYFTMFIYPFIQLSEKVEAAPLCLTFCYCTDCSLLGSSVHGILQARILEWIPVLLSRGSSQPRDWTQVSCIVGKFFTIWATRKPVTQLNDTHLWNLYANLWSKHFEKDQAKEKMKTPVK